MSATGVQGGVADYFRLVKFSHSVFALPFALIALLVSADGRPGLIALLWIVVAMVAARTAAMAYNRYVDRDVDAANPRTREREIPRGALTPAAALGLTLGASAVFVAAAAALGDAPLYGSAPVLVVLLGYSHAKRFTSLSHLWLGVALGLAPPGAALAVAGGVDASVWHAAVLGLGVSFWVAGFDVLYSCQDEAFDRAQGLHSLPARLGQGAALQLARLSHLLAFALFVGYGLLAGLGVPFYMGVLLGGLFLGMQHRLVRPGQLERIDAAFFTMNAWVSVVMLGCTLVDLYLL